MPYKKKAYPFENLSLSNIKNERWQDIPGLDGYYSVSSFGRIKRSQYEMQYKNGAIYVKPEKIIKLQIVTTRNRFKKDFKKFLSSRVTVNGIRYNCMVGRLVYYCFVEQFDIENKSIVIFYKDDDPFNIRPSNLTLATLPDKQQRIIRLKHGESHFSKMTQEQKQKQRMAINSVLEKPVVQFTLKGKRIRGYKSIRQAELATGIHAQSIGSAASGILLSSGGYRWALKGNTLLDLAQQRRARREAQRKNFGLRVTQYDMQGNRIKIYHSFQDAREATGAHPSAIRSVINGEYKSAKGYYWMEGQGRSKIDLSKHIWGRASQVETQSRSVVQCSLAGKRIKIFHSIKEAAREMKVHTTSILDACKGRSKTCGGYKWRYLN